MKHTRVYSIIYIFCLVSFVFSCKHKDLSVLEDRKTFDITSTTLELISCKMLFTYRGNNRFVETVEKAEKNRFEYTINVPFSAENLKLEAVSKNKNANMIITNKEPEQLAKTVGAEQRITFIIFDGSSYSKPYTVLAKREAINTNSTLSSLQATFIIKAKRNEVNVNEGLAQNKEITIGIPYSAKHVNLEATAQSSCATIEVTKDSNDLLSTEGSTKEFNIKVVAESGDEGNYKVICKRENKSSNANLKELSLFADGKEVSLSPAFSKTQKEYTATVPCFASLIQPKAVAESPCAIVSDLEYEPINFKTQAGQEQRIAIKVLAEDGSSSVYSITSKRDAISDDADLSYIMVNNIKIPCDAEHSGYVLSLPYTSINAKLQASAHYSSAKVYILPKPTVLLQQGENVVEILVVAERRKERRYHLKKKKKKPEFKMIKINVPTSGVTLPKGVLNEQTGLVEDTDTQNLDTPFEIANYELAYSEWYDVFLWALENGYSFDRAGVAGSHGAKEIDQGLGRPLKPAPLDINTQYHPVTQVTWRDVIVWCNAKNEKEGLDAVYYYEGEPLKSAIKPTEETKEDEKPDYIADDVEVIDTGGYRLPTEVEWELASRLTANKINSVSGYSCTIEGEKFYFTKGDSASGSFLSCNHVQKDNNGKFILDGAIETRRVAHFKWFFNGESNAEDATVTGTAPVGTKEPNFVGLYDMTGNVEEFCFDKDYSIYRARRGGAWTMGPKNLQVGLHSSATPAFGDYKTGFRLARSIK